MHEIGLIVALDRGNFAIGRDGATPHGISLTI